MTSIKIHLVSCGTSCNDIIKTLNNNKETRSLNLKKQKIPLLTSNGVREMYLSQQNPEVMKILTHAPLFSILDNDSIESALVLNYVNSGFNINLLPLAITTPKDKKYIQKMKELFGSGTETEKYWKHKEIDNLFTNIKEKVSQIRWVHIDPKKIYIGSFHYLKKIINDILYPTYYTSAMNEFIIVCNNKLILDVLKNCKGSSKYSKDDHIVDNSSVWTFNVTCNFAAGEYVFDAFKKIYPSIHNFSPLKMIDNTSFEYEFNRDKFILYDPLKPIPMNFIKKLSFTRFPKEDKQQLINFFHTKDKLNSDASNKNNSTTNRITFNDFLKK